MSEKKIIDDETYVDVEAGEPNPFDTNHVSEGPGEALSKRDPRLGHHGTSIDNVPARDPGVRQQDLDEVGPGFPKKGGPGYKE